MPNWVCNHVKITCKSKEDLQKIIDAITGKWLGQTFIPRTDEVRKDWDLELLYGWNWHGRRTEHWLDIKSWEEAWYKECPYKQLWYRWQCENWWSKWDYFIEKIEDLNWDYNLEEWTMDFFYDSAWTPHIPVWKTISEKLWCHVELSFEEPWECYSWEYEWQDWNLIVAHDYNDAFYGHWKKCSVCGCEYDDTNPDERMDEAHTVCYCCEESDDLHELKNK